MEKKNKALDIIKYMYVNGSEEIRKNAEKELIKKLEDQKEENVKQSYFMIINEWNKEREDVLNNSDTNYKTM